MIIKGCGLARVVTESTQNKRSDKMLTLRNTLQKLVKGEKVPGWNLSVHDIQELVRIYNELIEDRKSSFINGHCHNVLTLCNITVKTKGVGWEASI